MIDITVINDYGDTISVNDLLIKKNLENLFQDQQVPDAKVSIILSNKFLLNQLKKNYFKVDQFTDVINFIFYFVFRVYLVFCGYGEVKWTKKPLITN